MDDFAERFSRFKGSKYAIPVGMVITFVLCYVTLGYLQIACLSPLLVAVLAYVVPRYFGLKDLKRHIAFGIVLFIGIGLILGFQNGTTILEWDPQPVASEDMELYNGTISEYRGDTDQLYSFSVVLADDINATGVTLELADVWSGDDPAEYAMFETGNVSGGTLFGYETTVDASLHQYRFLAEVDGEEVATDAELGPLTASSGDVRETYLLGALLGVFFGSFMIFLLIALLTFWMRRNMEKAMQRQEDESEGNGPSDEVEKFICSECGAEVPADAKECPQCGERFEVEDLPEMRTPEADSGTFICSECGAEVSGDAEVCPNCGERFED